MFEERQDAKVCLLNGEGRVDVKNCDSYLKINMLDGGTLSLILKKAYVYA